MLSRLEIIRQHYIDAKSIYPGLSEPVSIDREFIIVGTVDIIDKNNTNWGTYEVKIVIPADYPMRIPILYETGGKIERLPEWHVNANGSCCLGPPAKIYMELFDGITLLNWLNKLVIPFLANHILKFKTGQYVDGEYSHGKIGIIEFYRKWLRTENYNEILRKLKYITGDVAYGRNDKCFCVS